MCTVVNFQNLKVVHLNKFFEEELFNEENGKGNVHKYYMLNQGVKDSFFYSIHFLVFLLSYLSILPIIEDVHERIKQ